MKKFLSNIIFKEDNKHPSWQVYDQITFEEVDDNSNTSLQILPEKVFYNTSCVDKRKDKRLFLFKTKDISANNQVVIRAVTKKDLESMVREKLNGQSRMGGYYHIAGVQILVKWLGNAGINIPIKVAIRDERIIDVQKSILGLWASNLYTGAVYTILGTDMLVSADDKNLDSLLTFGIKADIELAEGSQALAITTSVYASWTKAPHPFRQRNGDFGLEQLKEGKTVYLKPRNMDIMTVPKPIPLQDLDYDLEFNFSKPEKMETKVSNEVEYHLNTKEEFIVKLKEPRQKFSTSRRFAEGECSFSKEDESD